MATRPEINPKYTQGEPVCGGCRCAFFLPRKDCESNGICGSNYGVCRDVLVGYPCVPALKRDRDKYKVELAAALERERELQRQICTWEIVAEYYYDSGNAISRESVAEDNEWNCFDATEKKGEKVK